MKRIKEFATLIDTIALVVMPSMASASFSSGESLPTPEVPVKGKFTMLELRYKEKRVAQLGPLKRAMDLRRNLEV